MAAYLVAKVKVTDWERYRRYMALTPDAIHRHGGHFIVRGGERVTLEGPDDEDRIVVIAFPSLDQVKAFYASPEYQAAKALREGAAIASLIAVDGVEA